MINSEINKCLVNTRNIIIKVIITCVLERKLTDLKIRGVVC